MNEDFEAILSHVIEKTGHERYRWLTSEANPDEKARTGYRRLVVERYQQLLSEPEYPPLFEQAKGAGRHGPSRRGRNQETAGSGAGRGGRAAAGPVPGLRAL